MYKAKYRLSGVLICLIAIVFSSCASSEPEVFFQSSPFQWHQNSQPVSLSIPTTSAIPGSVTTIQAQQEIGYGPLLQSTSIWATAVNEGRRILMIEVDRMKSLEWHPLFNPVETGTFPNYVLYVTFQSDSYYCFVEYSATYLSASEMSQEIDIYHN